MVIKGQNLRLFLGDKVIACATSCTLHVSADLEDTSTKDDTGDWKKQEATGKSWDCSADALMTVETDSSANTLNDIFALIGTQVTIEFLTTSGEKNRVVATGFAQHGNAIVNDISINAGNKQNVTYSIQMGGNGPLASGSATLHAGQEVE